jgi:hypothetical protein
MYAGPLLSLGRREHSHDVLAWKLTHEQTVYRMAMKTEK